MIYIFYCTSRDQLDVESFDSFLKHLPKKAQFQILKFKKWDDRQRSLFSKLLLINGLNIMGHNTYSIDQLKYTWYKRPYFDNNIDFNISHSSEYIICGISFNHQIGIDIEEVKEIPIGDFENEFSLKEMEAILNSEKSLHSFYTLWTQKESFLKAIGTGLHVSLNKIGINNEKIKWNNKNWYLSELKLDSKYVCHLCVDFFHPDINIQKINFQ